MVSPCTHIGFSYIYGDAFTSDTIVHGTAHLLPMLSERDHVVSEKFFFCFDMTRYKNWGPQGGSGAMWYVQNSLACYVLCKFLFTLLCEIKIGYVLCRSITCAMCYVNHARKSYALKMQFGGTYMQK